MRRVKSILFAGLLLIVVGGYAQVPLGINYQGVARSADGSPLINQIIGLRLSITSGPNGSSDYVEEYHPETNEFGLFTVVVGQGQSSGNIGDVDWGAGNKWLQIEVDPQDEANYLLVGTQQMMSVPYALYAAKSGESLTPGFGIDITNGQVNNLLPDKVVTLTGTGSATVSGTYPNFTIEAIDNVDDADADATNEIQALSKTGNTIILSNGGGSITDAVNDADADASNELLQAAVLNGTNLELTDAAGTKTVDLSTLQDGTGTDNQNLGSNSSGTNRTITITGGTSTTFSVADDDNSTVNELQTISKTGSLVTLSNGGGAFTDAVNDADADASNELLQAAVLNGTNLELTDAAGMKTVDLSTLQDGTGTDNQNLGSNSSGTNRTITITGGTSTTFSVADDDNSTVNELQTISKTGSLVTLSNGGGSFTDAVNDADADATNEFQTMTQVGNSVTLSNSGGTISVDDGDSDITNEIQNLTDVLTVNNDAGGNKITNLADPINPQDVVNLRYLEAKDATDYAISVPITYTSLSVGDVPLDLSASFTLDKGNLISGSVINIAEPGVYAVSVQGISGITTGSDIEIKINGAATTVLKGLNHYLGVYLFDLSTNDQIEIVVKFGALAETINLQISVYKI